MYKLVKSKSNVLAKGSLALSLFLTVLCQNTLASPSTSGEEVKCESLLKELQVIDLGYRGKPKQQCGGTCYLETALLALNHTIWGQNQEIGLSRPFFTASIIKRRLEEFAESRRNGTYDKTLPGHFSATGGTFNEVLKIIQDSEFVATRPNNKSLIKIKEEEVELKVAQETLYEILRKGRDRIRPVLKGEQVLVKGLLKEILPHLKRATPKRYYKLMGLLDPRTYNYMSLSDIASFVFYTRMDIRDTDPSTAEKIKLVEDELNELMSERIEIHFIEYQVVQEALEYLDGIIAKEIQNGKVKLPLIQVDEIGATFKNFQAMDISGTTIIDFLKSHDATEISYLDIVMRGQSNSLSSLRREDTGHFLDLPATGDYAIPKNPTQFLFRPYWFPGFKGGMHAALVTGIRTDADGNLTHIEVMQSWGPLMGNMGRHLIGYEYLRRYGSTLIGLKKME